MQGQRRRDRIASATILTALALVIASSCGCARRPVIQSDTDIAVALPPDWEARCGVSVTDTPVARAGWFAVSGAWLKDQIK